MGRKNRRGGAPQARRREGPPIGTKPNRKLERTPIEQMVVPKGRCFFQSRRGKFSYTADEVEKALAQAQRDRLIKGHTKTERRYYACPEGGCGGYHITSRETYTTRNEA